jgi:hypothetical protein
MVHASEHAVPLAPGRLEDLQDEALPARASRGLRRWAIGLAVAAGLTLAVGVGLRLAPERRPAAPAPPAHLTSRSTRDVLPEAFPADQTASARIDLVYQSRLGAYREVLLDGRAPRPRGGRR